MSLLSPLFLVALAGLAIPVLVHLIQREKKRVVQFPSLMFLQRIPYSSVRRRRVHNWLLLLVRLTALALLVLAFARPFLRRGELPLSAAGSREVVVLLDQSYSMGYGDRWEKARAAARTVVKGLTAGDRASLVLFSSDGTVAVRATQDHAQLLSAIDAARVADGATRFGPALKLAATLLGESTQPRRDAVLISDFQRNGWQGGEPVYLPQGAELRTVPVEETRAQPNAAVVAVSMARSTFAEQERVTVTAGLRNYADTPLTAADVKLELSGRAIQTERVTVPARGSASVSFAPITVNQPQLRASVRLAADGLAQDNVRYFIVAPRSPVPVLVVDASGGAGAGSLYVLRALSIGESPAFAVTVRTPDAVSDDVLGKAAVVVLNDVSLQAGLASRLAAFVGRGGGLLVAAGPRASWPGSQAALLPAALAGAVDRTRGEAARLGAVEYGHPLFELFRAARSGDFSSAQFYGFRQLTPAAGAAVLARFDAGAPALVEQGVGRGHVLLWASSLDLSWNDLALKPVYLPFIHRAVRHLAMYAESTPWETVGQVLDPARLNPREALQPSIALAPSGARAPVGGKDDGVLVLAEQGFYEVRAAKAGAEGVAVAANVDVAESDLDTMDPRALLAAAVASGGVASATPAAPPTPEAQERTQRLWWYLLLAGLLLLGVDTVFSNRLSRA